MQVKKNGIRSIWEGLPYPHVIDTTPLVPLLQFPLSRFFVVPEQMSTLTEEFFLGRNNTMVFSLGAYNFPRILSS